jgi:TIR domain
MTSPEADQRPIRLFYSYSHVDKRLRKQLEEHLALLKRQGFIQEWHDRMIGAGQEWRGAIDQHLEESNIILLLISPSFLGSDYCYDVEMKRALEKHEADEARVIPIIVRPVDWSGAPFSKLQALPEGAKPITRWSNRDEGWKDVASSIRKACEEKAEQARQQKLAEEEGPRQRGEQLDQERQTEEQADRPLSSLTRPVQYGFPEDLIDFEDQQQLFKKMLDNPPVKRLMFVQAPDGRGKTSLLRILSFHCEHEGVPYCSIDNGKQPYDSPYLTLPLAMCDQLGLSPRHLAQAVQPLSTSKPQGEINNAEVVSQILTGVSLSHEGLRQRYLKERLRDAFIADLGQLVEKKGRVVCLFDGFEHISVEEEDWLFDTLLWPVAREKLKGVMIVIAGCRWPKINKWEWEQGTYLIDGLPSMNVEHIKIYAEKVNIKMTDEEARYYWRASGGGIPLHMVMVVHNLKSLPRVG